MSTTGFNYAKFLGIESVAGAAIFAAAYVPLFLLFVYNSIRRPTYVFIVLSLFCAIRLAAFTIRAILAGSESAGENLNLYIADQVLFGVGFFGLLYSAYTLVLDRWLLAVPEDREPDRGILRLTTDRRAFRLLLMVAVILGIIGATKTDSSDPQNGQTFKEVSTIIFLVLTVLFAFQTVRLNSVEGRAGFRTPGTKTMGSEHGSRILCVIALLLLVREIFTTATMTNAARQENEHFWYPLYALPEILAVSLYAIPGLVPSRSELPKTFNVVSA
ncbi:hypothetical protein H0H92_009271 [Tricholoma furcatifolium]|nr:hypothetical protein H0H92_009271 [Tricholoma furcatifolium]